MKTTAVTNKEIFGQVFTSQKVAKLMAGLIKSRLTPRITCLDPCIGGNVFLNEIAQFKYGKLVGIELDPSVLDNDKMLFFDRQKRHLLVKDFFDYSYANKFDVIIMNPPYVRQELLVGDINSKRKIAKKLVSEFKALSRQSNLYVYFLLKALRHLKKNGALVAIIYDAWLFTDYGENLKNIIFNKYSLKKVVHFKHGAFQNANVGATVILIHNESQTSCIEYFSFDSPDDIRGTSLSRHHSKKLSTSDFITNKFTANNFVNFEHDIFVPISSISCHPITRGVSAMVNKFFVLDKPDPKIAPYVTKFIKDVANIKKFQFSNEQHYLLKLPRQRVSGCVKDRLEVIKEKVDEDSTHYKSLRKKINNDKYWFSIPGSANGNIIFNYYMRNNIHFILNQKRHLVSDNFYNIYIEKNIYQNICILNSMITKFTLLAYGKSQGDGLFKIQLSQFKKVPVIDICKLKKKAKDKLDLLGRELTKTKRADSNEVLQKIDKVLIEVFNAITGKTTSYAQWVEEVENLRSSSR